MGGNNFWRMANFSVGYSYGLFKDNDLHNVVQLFIIIEEMDVVILN